MFSVTWHYYDIRFSKGSDVKVLDSLFFVYSLVKLWNSLPSLVRLSRDANDFRSKLHDYCFLERVL